MKLFINLSLDEGEHGSISVKGPDGRAHRLTATKGAAVIDLGEVKGGPAVFEFVEPEKKPDASGSGKNT